MFKKGDILIGKPDNNTYTVTCTGSIVRVTSVEKNYIGVEVLFTPYRGYKGVNLKDCNGYERNFMVNPIAFELAGDQCSGYSEEFNISYDLPTRCKSIWDDM